ncbi:hypothetical protein BH10ACI3_BH10ACI3_02430 [soil metagenome]
MGKLLQPFGSRQELDAAMKVFSNELIAADFTFGLYCKLNELTRLNKAVYARTWAFWLNISGALLSQAVLDVCRIYDGDHRTNGLPVILRKLILVRGSTDSKLAEHLKLVIRTDPVVIRLSDWRNEVLAHTNHDRATGKIKPKSENLLLQKDISTLIERAMKIYSAHSGSFMSREVNRHLVPVREADFIFTTLARRIEDDTKETRAFLEQQGVNPDIFLSDGKQ